ncbi:killer cell lectin-like receptor subfamily B member 1F [Porphyrio hochstetteri]
MDSDLVVIESQEELEYLRNQSRGHYYFLGLTYSESKGTWKWINNMDHNTSMFPVERCSPGYFCSVIGHGKVEDAHCNGSSTTQNMCKKPATPSERNKQR